MNKKIPQVISVLALVFILVSGTVDLDNLFNYEAQQVPSYIAKDNTPETNQIDDKIATLGRVLFMIKIYLIIIQFPVLVAINKLLLLVTRWKLVLD